jgi:hypothetical protein
LHPVADTPLPYWDTRVVASTTKNQQQQQQQRRKPIPPGSTTAQHGTRTSTGIAPYCTSVASTSTGG